MEHIKKLEYGYLINSLENLLLLCVDKGTSETYETYKKIRTQILKNFVREFINIKTLSLCGSIS